MPERPMTPGELAERWNTTTDALAQMRYRGTGPVFTRIGARKIRYLLADVLAYEGAQRSTRTDVRAEPVSA